MDRTIREEVTNHPSPLVYRRAAGFIGPGLQGNIEGNEHGEAQVGSD